MTKASKSIFDDTRRNRDNADKAVAMQCLVDEARAGGLSAQSMVGIRVRAVSKAGLQTNPIGYVPQAQLFSRFYAEIMGRPQLFERLVIGA